MLMNTGEKGKIFKASLSITARFPLVVNVEKGNSPLETDRGNQILACLISRLLEKKTVL
jgi:hypothetical protein